MKNYIREAVNAIFKRNLPAESCDEDPRYEAYLQKPAYAAYHKATGRNVSYGQWLEIDAYDRKLKSLADPRVPHTL